MRSQATRSSRFLRQSARKNNNCWLSTPSAKIYDNPVSRYSFPKDDDFDPSVRNLIIETKEKVSLFINMFYNYNLIDIKFILFGLKKFWTDRLLLMIKVLFCWLCRVSLFQMSCEFLLADQMNSTPSLIIMTFLWTRKKVNLFLRWNYLYLACVSATLCNLVRCMLWTESFRIFDKSGKGINRRCDKWVKSVFVLCRGSQRTSSNIQQKCVCCWSG